MSESSFDLVPAEPQPRRRRGKYASKTARLRDAMMAAVTPRDVYEITKLQVFLALKGDPFAAREVLDRTVGKAVSVAELTEMERSEMAPEERALLAEELREMIDSVPQLEMEEAEAESVGHPNAAIAATDTAVP